MSETVLRIQTARRKKILRRILWCILTVVILGGLIYALVYYSYSENRDLPGTAYYIVGREHIGFRDTLPEPYNSNPPSSGAHYLAPANWGIYDYEINDKILIHNLEHGGIWISYRPKVSPEVVSYLKTFVDDNKNSKLVMAPRSKNDADIAIVAWGRVLKVNIQEGVLADADKENIRTFYQRLKNHGPEFVPDTMPGVDPKSVE